MALKKEQAQRHNGRGHNKHFFKCAQRVILLVCKVSLSFHISFLSYRGRALCAPPRDSNAKKPRGIRVKTPNNEFIRLANKLHLLDASD